MEKQDLKFMREAVKWANDCHTVRESIPVFGTIIAVEGESVRRGSWGTRKEGDDEHTEWHARELLNSEDRTVYKLTAAL
jgi:pyrimidine deaminase RibD-like protein